MDKQSGKKGVFPLLRCWSCHNLTVGEVQGVPFCERCQERHRILLVKVIITLDKDDYPASLY